MPARAACEDHSGCVKTAKTMKAAAKKRVAAMAAKPASAKYAKAKSRTTKVAKAKRSAKTYKTARTAKAKAVRTARLTPRRSTTSAALSIPKGSVHNSHVVQLIKSMAPSHGVPTWFALRIAHVESGYNPRLRGRAGEYGVFQMKCATAKGIGFRGNCSALLDPAVNVRWGLRHLSLAMKSSRGNLRLAASKHNGGLGRKTEVRGYVAKVF